MKSSLGDLNSDYTTTKEDPTGSDLEEGFLAPKSHGITAPSNQVSQKQTKSVPTEEASRKVELIKLFRQALCKGEKRCSTPPIEDEGHGKMVSTSQVSQKQTKSVLTEEGKMKEELFKFLRQSFYKGEQNNSEVLLPIDDETRKNKLLKLIQHAISKGESVLYDNAFLEQCTDFLQFENREGPQPRMGFLAESIQAMVTEIVEELHGALSAEMEIEAPSLCENEGERNVCYGPLDKRLSDKEDGAVSGVLQLSKQKVDHRVEKGVSAQVEKGRATVSLGERACSYADMVKVGKQHSVCLSPSRASQLAFSNSSFLQNGTCMGSKDKAPPAVLNDPLHSLAVKEPVSGNATLASINQACSDIIIEENKQVSDFPVSSKENTPILKIDNEILNKRMSLCKFSIIGKISLAKGEEPWTVQKLRGKLEEIWKLHSAWRLIGLGKGFFQILLLSQDEWDKVWARGMIHLKPGTMRLQRWFINFDPLKERTTNAQVWFRIYQLPWGLWDPNVISGIACKVGVPLKIDNATLNGDFGYFARVLVDVDMSTELISEVQLECGKHKIEVKLSPENLPAFCNNCHTIGHCSVDCRHLIQKTNMLWQPKQKRGGEPDLSIAEIVCTKVSKTDHASTRRKEPILSHIKAGNEVECFDEIFVANRVESSMDFRIVDDSVMKDVFNVMGDDKQVQLAPDNQASGVEIPTCALIPVPQDSCKGESNKGKSVHISKIESPNRFSALSENVEEDVVESSLPSIPKGDHRDIMSCTEDEFITPNLPEKWSDIIDEDTETERQYSWEEANAMIIKAQSNFDNTYGSITEFRARLHEDCLWLNKDDTYYDRDIYAEREHYKNSAKETRNFIANLPKKDKKVKIGFRQPQGRNHSPKD